MSTFRTGLNANPGVSTDWRGLTVAKITDVDTPSSGPFEDRPVYSWIEQTFDPATGAFEDSPTPRKGTYTSATVFTNPLLDLNDAVLEIDSYVWIRLKGMVYGGPCYETASASGSPRVYWVKLTGSGAGIDGGTAWAGRIQDEDAGVVTDNGYIGADPDAPTYVMYRTLAEDASLGSPAIGDIVLAVPDKDTPGVWLFQPKRIQGLDCGGCGWLEDVPEDTCFKFKLEGGEGRCSCIPAEGFETSGSGVWVDALQGWISTQMKSACCGCGAAILEIDSEDCRNTTVTLKQFHVSCQGGSAAALYDLVMKFECSGINEETGQRFARFVGKGADACDGEVEPCANTFYLTVECYDCPEFVCGCCCTDYGPWSWYTINITGFGSATLNGAWVWEYADDPEQPCRWVASCEAGGNVTSVIEFIESGGTVASSVVRLTHGAYVYEIDRATWSCHGQNSFAYVSGGGTHPGVVTVNPVMVPDIIAPLPCSLPDSLEVEMVAADCPSMNFTVTVTRPIPGIDEWEYVDVGVLTVYVECNSFGQFVVGVDISCEAGTPPPEAYGASTGGDAPDSISFEPVFEATWTGVAITPVTSPTCCEGTATIILRE